MNHRLISILKNECFYNLNWQMTGRSTAGWELNTGGPVSACPVGCKIRVLVTTLVTIPFASLIVFGGAGAE